MNYAQKKEENFTSKANECSGFPANFISNSTSRTNFKIFKTGLIPTEKTECLISFFYVLMPENDPLKKDQVCISTIDTVLALVLL